MPRRLCALSRESVRPSSRRLQRLAMQDSSTQLGMPLVASKGRSREEAQHEISARNLASKPKSAPCKRCPLRHVRTSPTGDCYGGESVNARREGEKDLRHLGASLSRSV